MIDNNAMNILAETSRTFLIPISGLVPGLQEPVASAYLCMRAIDEIEDHPDLSLDIKIDLLRQVGRILNRPFKEEQFVSIFRPYESILPVVTMRLFDWAMLSPSSIAPKIWNSTSSMATQMADWVEREWKIHTEEDLDSYTYCVAGAVGELLSEIWLWFDGTTTDQREAIGFGRGLQAVNMMRNRGEDLARGVDFFPDNWGLEEMFSYTRRNLTLGEAYVEKLKPGPARDFCQIPLALANGTIEALAAGESKLNRAAVREIVRQLQENES